MSTVAWITARGLLGRRRFFLLFPLPLLMIGLAVLSRGFGVASSEWAWPVINGLGFTVVLPVVALIVGTAVLGAEIDDGTIVHVLAKPLPRWRIVLPKLAVAAAVTAVTVAIPMYVTGVLAEGVRLGLAVVAASVVGAVAYSALFVALSLVTRRPVLLGLVYVLIWEGLLGNLISGTRVLSIQQYAVTLTDWIAATPLLDGSVGRVTAVVMSVIVTAAFTWLAVERLRSFSVAGETG
jgi:ABC-2 type transport system permease protein